MSSHRRSGPTPISNTPQPTTSSTSKSKSPRHKAKTPKNSSTKDSSESYSSTDNFTVKDIGGSSLPTILASMLHENLLTPDANGKRLLSSPLLSDDKGLRMWSKITHLPDYYQTRDEIEMLERCGGEIVRSLGIDYASGYEYEKGLVVIDLGAGDIRKVLPLLHHLTTLSIPITYYALDLSHPILLTAMSHLRALALPNLTCHGLWGTFDSALSFVQDLSTSNTTNATTPRLFLSLGSSFGNDFHAPAVERLRAWRDEMRPCDRMLLGMDGTTNLSDIWDSYHPSPSHPSKSHLFEKFMRNGLHASNSILGYDWYHPSDWSVEGILTTSPYIMHRFVFTAKREVRCEELGLLIEEGEKIDCYEAFKYGITEMRGQFWESGLRECGGWTSESGRINQYLLCNDGSGSFHNSDGAW